MTSKRKALTLREKIEVIEFAEKEKCSSRVLAKTFGVGKTQITSLLQQKDLYRQMLASNANGNRKKKFPKNEGMAIDKLVYDWYLNTRNELSITGTMLQAKALEVATKLGCNSFKASNGWLDKFRSRNNIVFKTKEASTADEAEECEKSESREMTKNKWRSLRDYYRHEVKRVNSSTGSGHSSWVHFDKMQFLGQLTARKANTFNPISEPLLPIAYPTLLKVEYIEGDDPNQTSQICISDAVSLAESSLEDESGPYDDALQLSSSSRTSLSENLGPSEIFATQNVSSGEVIGPKDIHLDKTKRNNAVDVECTNESSELKRRKIMVLEKLAEDNDSDDLQFFKSLIPDLKDLPRHKKARIRLRIQQIIYEEVYGDKNDEKTDVTL